MVSPTAALGTIIKYYSQVRYATSVLIYFRKSECREKTSKYGGNIILITPLAIAMKEIAGTNVRYTRLPIEEVRHFFANGIELQRKKMTEFESQNTDPNIDILDLQISTELKKFKNKENRWIQYYNHKVENNSHTQQSKCLIKIVEDIKSGALNVIYSPKAIHKDLIFSNDGLTICEEEEQADEYMDEDFSLDDDTQKTDTPIKQEQKNTQTPKKGLSRLIFWKR